MACSSGCTTGPHATYGECLRAKGLQVADATAHAHRMSQESQVKEYIDARKSGIQPETFYKRDVDFARWATDVTGVPFRADKPLLPDGVKKN